MDFTPKPSVQWSDNFQSIIDAAMQAEQQAQTPRDYLGASRIGDDCLRKLGYEYHHAPKDPDRHFKGKTLRIFDRGHDAETRMAAYLRLAGFGLVTERADGRQIGFAVAWDEARGCYRIAGNCDGVITSAPYAAGLATPALWEMKSLGDTGWKDTVKKGVRASKPVYFAQMQLYMAYLDLTENPGLFTAINGNTGEIYAERVPFDKQAAQEASDKGVKVVSSASPEELPRVARERTDFRCKWCDFQDRCWAEPATAPSAQPWAWGGIGG